MTGYVEILSGVHGAQPLLSRITKQPSVLDADHTTSLEAANAIA